MNQHHYLKQQTVSDPDQQDHFRREENKYRSAPTETSRNQETNHATKNVAKGIDDRIALVTERRCFGAITIDDEVRIFKYFPKRTDSQSEPQLPDRYQPRQQKDYQTGIKEAMQDVGEAVRIEKLLRVV